MKRKSFLRQLLQSYLVIAILPLSLVLGYFFTHAIQSALAETQQELNAAAELASSQISGQFTNLAFISLNLVSDEEFPKAAGRLVNAETMLDERLSYSTLEAKVSTYAITDSIYDVAFFNDRGHYVTSSNNNHEYSYQYRLEEDAIEGLPWIGTARENYGQAILLPISAGLLPREQELSLALVRALRDPGKTIGYIIVKTELSNLGYIFQSVENLGAEMLILDGQREPIYSSEGFPQQDRNTLEKAFLLSSRTDPETGIQCICLVSKAAAARQAVYSLLPLLLSSLLLVAIIGIGMLYFGRRLTAPLVTLTEHMKQTTLENLNEAEMQLPTQSYEEVTYLFAQFNKMRKRLSTMMQRQITARTLQIQERLHSLQAQINPHFLYNTLNMIGIMGMESGSQDIYDSCRRLSSIMRYSIADRNDELSTVAQERENVCAYLELMKLRYEHRLEYQVEFEEEILTQRLPRLVLQPFVENIFSHAYDQKHTMVLARLRGWCAGDRWYIEISDNGAGIPEVRYEELVREIESFFQFPHAQHQTHTGIGILNTLLRLNLHFGKAFVYELHSRPGAGTRILISSVLQEEAYEQDSHSDRGR